MKNTIGALAGLSCQKIFCGGFCILTTFVGSNSLLADAPPALTTIRSTGVDYEGRRTYTIEWDAASNTLYRIQARSGFESNTTWQTIDLAQPAGSRGLFSIVEEQAAAPDAASQQFLRVLAPQPEIFAVEPALLGTNGGTAYLIGQCLGSNVSLRIANLVLAPNTLQPGSVYSFDLSSGGLPEGTYDVEVLDGTNVVARASKLFSIAASVQLAGAKQRLLEAPVEPPASPSLLSKHQEKGNKTKCKGNIDGRVLPATGELQLQETDLYIPGRGLDFEWTRTYRSRTGTNTVMGQNWSHSYDVRVTAGSGSVTVWDGTGRADTYFADSNLVYTADELFNVGVFTNTQFWLIFPDGGRWEFNHPLHGLPTSGKLVRIVDRLGDSIRMFHSIDGQLLAILDTLGRTNTVTYEPSGRVSSVTDFSGRTVRYTYYRNGEAGGGNGDLRSVTTPTVTGTPNGNDFPQGKTTVFTYSTGFADPRLNRNLLTITDPLGQTWFSAEYGPGTNVADVTFDRVLSTRRGEFGAPRAILNYAPQVPSASNRWAVMKTIVNDPVGNVTIDWFDSLNRGIVHRDIAARAQPDTLVTETNLPTVKLRDTDPDHWETQYEWNKDSLCTRVTFPRGNSTEFVYQRAFNQNDSRGNNGREGRRSDGNPRVIRERACCGGADTDGDGDVDVTKLVWRMEFDPRFGSPATMCGAGQSWTFPSGPRQSTSLDSSRVSTAQQVSKVIVRGWDPTTKMSARKFNRKAEDSYEPWNVADEDEGVISNPLYEQSGVQGVNPLYERSDFVVRSTNPRGSKVTGIYSEKASCVSLTEHGDNANGTDARVTNFEYDALFGQLAAVVYPDNGNKFRRRDTFSYSPSNGLLREWTIDTTGPTVSIISFEHDLRGNVTQTVDARGNTNQFIYNQLDQCVRAIEPSVCAPCPGVATDFFYDGNDNLTQTSRERRDKDGVINANDPAWVSLRAYDLLNRQTLLAHELTHTVQQRFATNRFTYDANDNLIEDFSPEAINGNQPGNLITYDYDTRGFLWRQVRGPSTPQQSTDEFDYDENGNLVRSSYGAGGGAGGTIRLSTYDGFDRCATKIDPMGNVSRFAYDNNHNLVFERHDGQTNDMAGGAGNRRLGQTRYEYDSLDRRTRTRYAFFDIFMELPLLDGESTTTFTYAPNGTCRSATDDNGNTATYSYDSRGRIASITDPKTNIVSYLYDANDNVTSITQSDASDIAVARQAFVTSLQYDAMDRCILDYDNVGNTNRYFYDSGHNLTHQLDPRGNWQRWQYDGLSRTILIETDMDGDGDFDSLDITRTQVWDDNSRLVSVIDDNTNTTRYAYDVLNRRVATTNADGTVESLIWSPRSNISQRTDPNGTRIVYTHDLLDRVTRKDITPGMNVATNTTFEKFEYDGVSRLVMASNDVSMIDFSYDSMGNLAKQKQDCIAAAFAYDGEGNRTSMTYPHGRVVSWTYDPLNLPSTVSSSATSGVPATLLSTFAYEGAGRLNRMSRDNGINTRINYSGDTKETNAPGDFGWRQIERINHQRSGGGTTIDRRIYGYDRAQNKISRTPAFPFLPASALRTNYWDYDPAQRMNVHGIGRTGTISSSQINRDGKGNRQAIIEDGVTNVYLMSSTLPEPADFQMDQYSVTPFGTREYDRNGNMVFIPGPAGGTEFTYDYANRLVSVARSVGPTFVPVVTFTYDCFGRRLSKTTYPPAPADADKTVFYYDGGDIIEEQDGNGTPKKTVVFPHALEVSGRIMFTGGETHYLIADELGNALALTDDAGDTLERYEYDGYGQPEFLTTDGVVIIGGDGQPVTSSPLGNSHLFRAMFWDHETGLYAGDSPRYLDPKMGRYLDRGGDSGNLGRSAFTFAGDNPWTVRASGDPIHGVDVKLGLTARSSGDPIHGVDVKLGLSARASGDPIHGVDVKLGLAARSSGDPIHGVDVKLGLSARGGGGGSVRGYFNPKEITIDKPVPWKTKKEEGGRHTPFHNKYRPSGKYEVMFNPREYTITKVVGGAGGGGAGGVDQRTSFAVLLNGGGGKGCGDAGERIGSGAFGVVYKGKWRRSPGVETSGPGLRGKSGRTNKVSAYAVKF